MLYTPKKIYLTSGCGLSEAYHELLAFDRALAAAGVADFNLIKVSSIVPPHCQILQQSPPRQPGQLAPTVYSKMSAVNYTSEEGDRTIRISACIALATCSDHNYNGVIFEVAMKQVGRDTTERLATEMVKLAMEDRGLKIGELFVESQEMTIQEGEAGCVVIAAMMD